MKIVMLTAAGKATNIPATKMVAPINNTLHSLFKTCRVWLGETLISQNSDNYQYKSYFIDLLTYDGAAKFSWLEGQMYYQDNFGKTLASQTAVGNSGFATRMNLFKNEAQTAYHQGKVSAMGRLHTDLNSSECALIPGIGLRIELTFSSSDFLIQVPAADKNRYKLIIEKAQVLCPVAQLSDDVFRKLELKLAKEAASLYINRVEVTNKTIQPCAIFTDRLFAGAPLPSKLIFALVATENYIGTQTSNPFYFPRKYKMPVPPPPPPGPPGAGEEPPSQTTSSGRFFSFPFNSGIEEDEENRVENLEGDKDYSYVQRFNLTLNGENVDGFNTDLASSREDIENFLRLHYFMGFSHSRTGNNFTYEEFLDGFFFVYYDLSTCGMSNIDFVVPSVRQGNLQLQIDFSQTMPKELTLLIYAEYPTLIKIDKNRQVSMSY